MSVPHLDTSLFQFVDVGAKIPNYTPGQRWGTQGKPLTLMQKPLTAERSIETYATPKDFQLSLWASEAATNWPEQTAAPKPYMGLQGKPIAMNWDERGRLWICETIDYPNELQSTPAAGRDRIKICEDTDNDGVADKFTLFAQHLSIPSTLISYRGGVLVQDGQKTIYLKDVDGDDRADFRQELITGWAMGDTHGGVSNFQYGPDNWIWGMQGYNNSEPVINGERQMRFRQGFWRFKPRSAPSAKTSPAFALDKESGTPASDSTTSYDQHTLRVDALEFVRATNNNTWGLGFSEEGYVFGSTANGCPSVHMPIPNRFYDQVAGWSPKTLERIAPTNAFIPFDEPVRQVDQHGGYTAAAGHALYTARNYPPAWWNKIGMVCEPTAHLVGGFVLEKDGAGYKSRNTFNVVASLDDWVAPIMSEVGPDGNVWVLDWYNYIVQHNPTPNGFQTGKGAAYESDLRDKRFARVYRLLYKQTNAPTSPQSLRDASLDALVQALKSDNFFWRRTAQRLLVERNSTDAATLRSLVDLVSDSKLDAIGLSPAAMHAIWTLSGLVEQGNEAARDALRKACETGIRHPSSPVRHAAVESMAPADLQMASKAGLLQDKDPRVQLAMLLRLAEDASDAITPEALAQHLVQTPAVADDSILLDAWTSAASKHAVPVLAGLVHQKQEFSVAVQDRIAVLGEHVARSNPTPADLEKLLQGDPRSPAHVPVWQGLAKGWPREGKVELSQSAQDRIRKEFLAETIPIENRAALLSIADKWSIAGLPELAERIQGTLFQTALDANEPMEKRLEAWDQAIKLAPTSPNIMRAARQLLTPQLAPSPAMRALMSLQAARVEGLADEVLLLRKKLSPQVASAALTLLLSRAETTRELLDSIADGKVQFLDLQLDQRQALMNHPMRELANYAKELMAKQGALVSTNRQSLVDDWKPVTEMSGDIQNGIAMYRKHCALCHKHGEIGVAIGPNLTGMAVHPKDEILMNILDPSRSVENNFRNYQILTVDGTVLTGMLAGESANSLRLINSQGKEEQVLREDIEELNASTKSLMPEGFESQMTKQEMADLLSFLANRGRYTPLSLTGVSTLSGPKGMPGPRGATGEPFVLKEVGVVEFEGVPFELIDPQSGRTANIIALQAPRGNAPTSLPNSVSIPCLGKVSAIHLLGGIASFGYPINKNESTSMVVRAHYVDGSKSEFELINGKQIANYQERVDVPDSKFALDANGKQIRYLKIPLTASKELKSIELAKGDDFSTPLVFAITVESANADSH
ncbi:PVC-type heme-binding CxxCH protein [Pirellula sp. SH-Sr6A]|uniref:PVC-type heme-binding CxxCH protein n=1 Tax=Pirellula sp. SH-Sr6A TaxID=1632865 RepID=UPI0011BACBDF